MNKRERIESFLAKSVSLGLFDEITRERIQNVIDGTSDDKLKTVFYEEMRQTYSETEHEMFAELITEIIENEHSGEEMRANFFKRDKRLTDFREQCALCMQDDLQMPRSTVREWLKEANIVAIHYAVDQYQPISKMVEEKPVTAETETIVTRLILAINQAIYEHIEAMFSLKAFYDIPHIKALMNTIFSSYVWHSKQRFKHVNRDLMISFEKQRKRFTDQTKEIEQLYWKDFPERLQELEERSNKIQKKMNSLLTSKAKKQQLYQEYQMIQKEIAHPLFQDDDAHYFTA